MPLVTEDALTVVRAYHHAWTTRNFQNAAERLADTLVVEVPINGYPTKADFLNAVEMTRAMATEIDLLAEFGDAGGALLLYDMQLPMTVLRVAEHFTGSPSVLTGPSVACSTATTISRASVCGSTSACSMS